MRENTDNYRQLFINDTPMIDLRAPIEFEQGAFPTSVTLPLMTNDERALVGTCYKEQGQDAAIILGHKLVSGKTKDERMARWIEFTQQHPEGYLYCFRGGLRSRTTQQWLTDAGVDYPLVIGGYKALRTALLNQIEESVQSQSFTIVGGNTGCRKTTMVNVLTNGIDLEGAANHRGSSFGSYVSPQNTQINFENITAVALMKKQALGLTQLVFEDESRNIGSVDLPKQIHQKMQQSPVVVVEEPLEVRLQQLLKEYVIDMDQAFIDHYGIEHGQQKCAQYLLNGLDRIKKRLGNERWQSLRTEMEKAIKAHQQDTGFEAHFNWLSPLLEWYYDPMYEYQLQLKNDRIIYRGSWLECKQYLEANTL
ncbi:MAG: tRNA 2-selenouridine(34) synthase MnmH [Amphritea sp.]